MVPQENQSWWNTTFVDLATNAVGMWNNALGTFASQHSDFSYLSNINLEQTTSQATGQSFDVYVTWTEQIQSSLGAVGTAQVSYSSSGIVENCNIVLAAKDLLGISITDPVKQSIAAHEIGHALGLLHANYTDDVMYSETSFDIAVRPISTLDVYGVAQVFRWMSASSQFSPSNQTPVSDVVTLPSSGIDYAYLNEPQQDPLTAFASSFLRYIQSPEGLVMLAAALLIIFGIVVLVSSLRRKKTSESDEDAVKKDEANNTRSSEIAAL